MLKKTLQEVIDDYDFVRFIDFMFIEDEFSLGDDKTCVFFVNGILKYCFVANLGRAPRIERTDEAKVFLIENNFKETDFNELLAKVSAVIKVENINKKQQNFTIFRNNKKISSN